MVGKDSWTKTGQMRESGELQDFVAPQSLCGHFFPSAASVPTAFKSTLKSESLRTRNLKSLGLTFEPPMLATQELTD